MEIYDQNVAAHLNLPQEINSLQEIDQLHEILVNFAFEIRLQTGEHLMPHYRCEQCFGWNIVPGIFRGTGAGYDAANGKALEEKAAAEFKIEVEKAMGKGVFRDLFEHKKFGGKWDLLFQAQHAGIKTTLIDWTAYIQRSIYFAVEESADPDINNTDGQLWVYLLPVVDLLSDGGYDTFYDNDPLNFNKGAMINVSVLLDDLDKRVFESRIARQGGRFYISAADKCNVPMNLQPDIAARLYRFRIPAASKAVIRNQLNARGVNRESIYVQENPAHQAVIDAINQRMFV